MVPGGKCWLLEGGLGDGVRVRKGCIGAGGRFRMGGGSKPGRARIVPSFACLVLMLWVGLRMVK